MNITERKNEALYAEFVIQVPADQVQAQIDRRLKEIGKKVKVDGFRPGKAPIALLQKRYGDTARAESVEKTVEEATAKLLKEKEIRPAMTPKVDIMKFEDDNTLEFSVSVEKMPKIETVDLKTIKLEKMVAPVADAQIDEALERIAGNYKSSQPLEKQRPAKMGDIVRIDFDGSVGGKKLPGMKGEDFDLELGAKMFIDTFEDQLVGAKQGDEKTINVTFPADYGHDELSGKDAVFEVVVKEVREAAPAKVDDELAKKAGLPSLENLKNAIRNQMEREHNNLSRAKLKRALLDILDEKHKFDVPAGLVESEYQQIWQYHLQDMKSRDMDMEAAEKDEDSKAEFRTIAERRVRLGLLLSEIGEAGKVTVTNQELHQAVMREAYNYPGQEQKVVKFYQQNPQAIASLRAPIYEEKVVDHVLGQITLTEKEVTKEELAHDPDAEAEQARLDKAEGKKKAPAKKKAAAKKTA